MQQDWTIRRRADHCGVTGRAFDDGEPFYALLYPEAGEAFARRDVSEEGWRQLRADRTAPRPFSFWRSKYAPPPPVAPEALPKADAESRLRRFLAENRPEHARTIYILALMLERKKLLRPTDARDDESTGRRLLFYEHVATGESFVIVDPGLKLDQLEEIQREVADSLRAGVDESVGDAREVQPPPSPA